MYLVRVKDLDHCIPQTLSFFLFGLECLICIQFGSWIQIISSRKLFLLIFFRDRVLGITLQDIFISLRFSLVRINTSTQQHFFVYGGVSYIPLDADCHFKMAHHQIVSFIYRMFLIFLYVIVPATIPSLQGKVLQLTLEQFAFESSIFVFYIGCESSVVYIRCCL